MVDVLVLDWHSELLQPPYNQDYKWQRWRVEVAEWKDGKYLGPRRAAEQLWSYPTSGLLIR